MEYTFRVSPGRGTDCCNSGNRSVSVHSPEVRKWFREHVVVVHLHHVYRALGLPAQRLLVENTAAGSVRVLLHHHPATSVRRRHIVKDGDNILV